MYYYYAQPFRNSQRPSHSMWISSTFKKNVKGTVMQTEKALINDRLRALKVS